MAGERPSEKQNLLHDEHYRHKYHRRHLVQYALVVVVFVFALILLFQINQTVWQLAIITAVSAFYLVFGVWHHLEENNLTNKHILEYLVVSTIIFVALYSIFI